MYWTAFRFYNDNETEAVFQAGNRRELDAVERELRRRHARLNAAIPPTAGDRPRPAGETLPEVAQRIKQILTVPDALVDLGFDPRRTGTSRGRDEWHCSCPVCGGDDRLISWGPPESNWTCRQCRSGGDVVDLVQTALQVDFAEATRRLSRLAEIAT